VTDAVAEPADCVDLVVAHGDDVAEVQHRPDRRGSGKAIEGVVEHLGPVEVTAQPVRVRSLHQQRQARLADDPRCGADGAGHGGDVPAQLGARGRALPAAGQHDRQGADRVCQLHEGREPATQLRFVELRVVHVGDVGVDQPHGHAAVADLPGEHVDQLGRQRCGNVLAGTRQRPEVGLPESERGDLGQRSGQIPRPERDGGTAEPAVDRPDRHGCVLGVHHGILRSTLIGGRVRPSAAWGRPRPRRGCRVRP
jgi:hypothetical protein